MMRKTTSISAAILIMAIIADAQIGNPEEAMFEIFVDEVLLSFSSPVFFVVAPIMYEETGDDSDGLRVPSALEVIIGGVLDLTF